MLRNRNADDTGDADLHGFFYVYFTKRNTFNLFILV